MNQKLLLLLAAQGDPKRAAAIEDYLGVEDWQKLPAGKSLFTPPAGGYVPGPETVRPTIQTDVHPDGIYLVFGGQSPVIYEKYVPGTVTEDMKQRCTGIGVKLGSKSLVVDLYDMVDPDDEEEKDFTLTTKRSPEDYDKAAYLDSCEDAGADWNGKANTDRLALAGILNPKIAQQLKAGQWVPAMGEALFMHLFRKEINQALREVGGDVLPGYWYWTSTEYGATDAWRLYLSHGYMRNDTKASTRGRVRAVSAFIS